MRMLFVKSELRILFLSIVVFFSFPCMAASTWFAKTYLKQPQSILINTRYFNLKKIFNNDLDKIKEHLFTWVRNGNIVILDATGTKNIDETNNKLSNILGISTPAPITLMYMRHGELYTQAIIQRKGQSNYYNSINYRGMYRQLSYALKEISKTRHAVYHNNYSSTDNTYIQGLRRTHIISEKLSCSFGTLDDKDFCEDNDSTVNLSMSIQMYRSLYSQQSENAKFFRLTMNNQDGTGSGIHLSDNLNEIRKGGANLHRQAYLDPIIWEFGISAQPVWNSNDITVFRHIPQNINPESTYSETSGFSIGGGVSAGAEVGSSGPKVGVGVNASATYSASRTIKWTVKEYQVKNNSSDLKAGFVLKRPSDGCDLLSGDSAKQPDCATTSGWAYGGNLIDHDKISAIAYANMTPNFDFIFKAPPNKTDKTKFEINADLKLRHLRVRRVAAYFFSINQLYPGYIRDFPFHADYRFDWGSAVFEPEPNVNIKTMGANNECLKIKPGTTMVEASGCKNEPGRTWGLNAKKQYRSRLYNNLCLTATEYNRVYVEPCSDSQAQKWEWSGSKLKTLAAGKMGYVLEYKGHHQPIRVAPEAAADASNEEKAKQMWAPYLVKLF